MSRAAQHQPHGARRGFAALALTAILVAPIGAQAAAAGQHGIDMTVSISPTDSPGETTRPTHAPSPSSTGSEQLPETGASPWGWSALAGGLLVLGTAGAVLGRRRRTHHL